VGSIELDFLNASYVLVNHRVVSGGKLINRLTFVFGSSFISSISLDGDLSAACSRLLLLDVGIF